MTKIPYDRILREKPKEEYLNTVPKPCLIPYMKNNVYYQPNGKKYLLYHVIQPCDYLEFSHVIT